jgi:hypothetical protein
MWESTGSLSSECRLHTKMVVKQMLKTPRHWHEPLWTSATLHTWLTGFLRLIQTVVVRAVALWGHWRYSR